MSDDGQTAAASSKLEAMPREGLIKLVQSQMLLKKKLDARIGELTTSNSTLCQNVEELQNELDREKDLSEELRLQLEQMKMREAKIQQERNMTSESLECFRLQNETLKVSCQNFQKEIAKLSVVEKPPPQSDNNFAEISSQCLDSLLDRIEREDEQIRRSLHAFDLSSDAKKFPSPLTFDDLEDLLQSFVQTQSRTRTISISQINDEDKYQIEIPRGISPPFDTFLEQFSFPTANENLRLIFSKSTDQNLRLSFNGLDFVSSRTDDERQKEQFASILKREQQMTDLLEMKMNEAKSLAERVQNLEDDLKEYRTLVFEKTKQADDLDRQLQKEQNRLAQILEENQSKTSTNNDEEFQQTIENLRNELSVEQQRSAEFEEKIDQQTGEIKDLKEKQQKLKLLLTRLKKELDEKNAQQPKQSLIDLEIADYERTIKNLKENLDKKDKEIDDLRGELTESTRQISTLQRDVNQLDEEKRQIDERAKKFENLFETTRKELLDAKDLEHERHQNDDNIRQLFDKLRVESDNGKILLSQLAGEKQQLNDRFQQQTETSQRTIQLLEQNLRITQHELEVAKQDFESLQDDFQNYKIRAQSVLKQHQGAPREPSTAIKTRNDELEETNEKLRSTIEEANRKIQILTGENEDLKGENDRLSELQTKLTSELKKRETEWKKKHQLEIQTMENDFQRRMNESHDLLTNLTVQKENLTKSFQDQIASMRDEYERSISMLQHQLENGRIEIEKLKMTQKALLENDKESSQISTLNSEESPWIYAERQQGEGSESTSTDHQSTDIAVKTLENVLFGASGHSRSSSSVGGDRPRHVLFEDPELERQRLEDELSKTKVRLSNTTELLNESELNNVRLSEQVMLLKDEIRRLERNVERTESISNFEYLKNIILKFFVLKSSPERLQLIPVLVTMLKLSPEEQEQLTRVAQQPATSNQTNSTPSEPNQSIVTTNGNPSSSSWTSYLNLW